MTRFKLATAFTLGMIGCGGSTAPLPQTEDSNQAAQIVWQQAYKMDVSTMPIVNWYSGCLDSQDGLTVVGTCISSVVEGDQGDVKLLWQGSFSGSDYASSLDRYRIYLMHGPTALANPTKYPEWNDIDGAVTELLLNNL